MAIPGELIVTPDVPGAFTAQVLDAFRSRPVDAFSLALRGNFCNSF